MAGDFSPFRNPVCLALDVDDPLRAIEISKKLGPHLGGIKIGPRLVLSAGKDLIQEISKYCPVFVDLKHFDIPSTMLAAVRASFEAGASVVTVHALSGEKALTQVAHLEKELQKIRPFRVLAVTVLTSWGQEDLSENFKYASVDHHVHWASELVIKSGLSSVVCSPHEALALSQKGLFCLTPGIRFSAEVKDDQNRIALPKQALSLGANVLVIGRPLLQDQDPVGRIRAILSGQI